MRASAVQINQNTAWLGALARADDAAIDAASGFLETRDA
jgi:hypothetical protein